MFSHVTLGSADLDRAAAFYRPVMATLGLIEPFALDRALVFGEVMGAKLFIGAPFDGNPPSHGNGTHVALLAGSRAAVDAFHAAALAHGGSDEGAPGPRPHYHANYYGAYVRDPDGNKLQAVCHAAAAV
ncbi:VOC family protein [Sphingomonas sp.]|uniref:VOC family protein n=1 Tax=Sphingomonas sp. TaxID=28214 RepID=UPI003CC6BDAB